MARNAFIKSIAIALVLLVWQEAFAQEPFKGFMKISVNSVIMSKQLDPDTKKNVTSRIQLDFKVRLGIDADAYTLDQAKLKFNGLPYWEEYLKGSKLVMSSKTGEVTLGVGPGMENKGFTLNGPHAVGLLMRDKDTRKRIDKALNERPVEKGTNTTISDEDFLFLGMKAVRAKDKLINGKLCKGYIIKGKYMDYTYFMDTTIYFAPFDESSVFGELGAMLQKQNLDMMGVYGRVVSKQFVNDAKDRGPVQIVIRVHDPQGLNKAKRAAGSQASTYISNYESMNITINIDYEAKESLGEEIYNFDAFEITAFTNEMMDEMLKPDPASEEINIDDTGE